MGKNYICFLSGKLADLAVCEEEYVDFITQLLNNPNVRYYLANRFPIYRDNVIDIIEKSKQQKEIILIIIDKKTDNPAGIIRLFNINWPNGRAELSLAIMPEFQNAGLGKCASELIIKYAFETLGLRKICLEVYGFNKNAIKLYEKLGFVIEGEYKNHSLKKGTYHTLLFMCLIKRDNEK